MPPYDEVLIHMAAAVFKTSADTIYRTYPLALVYAGEHIWYWTKGIKCVPLKWTMEVDEFDFSEEIAILEDDKFDT